MEDGLGLPPDGQAQHLTRNQESEFKVSFQHTCKDLPVLGTGKEGNPAYLSHRGLPQGARVTTLAHSLEKGGEHAPLSNGSFFETFPICNAPERAASG